MGIHPPRLPDPTVPEADPVGHSRRGFLTRVAVGGAVLAVGSQVVPGGLVPLGAQEDDAVALDADETTLQLLASVALGASQAFRAAAEVPGIPETTVEVIRTFGGHHRSQATTFSGFLPADAPDLSPNATIVSEATAALAGASDAPAVLAVLRDLTEQIAATQLSALETVEDQNDAQVIAAALGTVSQHAVVLAVLGDETVESASPATQTTDGALTASSHPVTFADDAPAEGEEAADDSTGGGGAAEDDSTTTTGDDQTTTTTTEG